MNGTFDVFEYLNFGHSRFTNKYISNSPRKKHARCVCPPYNTTSLPCKSLLACTTNRLVFSYAWARQRAMLAAKLGALNELMVDSPKLQLSLR